MAWHWRRKGLSVGDDIAILYPSGDADDTCSFVKGRPSWQPCGLEATLPAAAPSPPHLPHWSTASNPPPSLRTPGFSFLPSLTQFSRGPHLYEQRSCPEKLFCFLQLTVLAFGHAIPSKGKMDAAWSCWTDWRPKST